MTYQQCLTCTRRNIPPEQVSCPACGSVDLRGYDPGATEDEIATPATKSAAATPATPATIHGPECPGDCEICENDADEKARPHARD